jgi:tetratricopeptide (TPR) repeat protein
LVTLTWIRASALAAVLLGAIPAGAAAPAAAPAHSGAPPAVAPAAAPAPSGAPPAAAPADAAPPPATPQEAEMQSHRALGHRLYKLGRYEEAVAAFRRAYEVKADARLLFDIAQCYRELGAVNQALFYYDRYLAGWPDAFDRAEVEERIAELESMRGSPAPRTAVVPRRRPIMISEPAPTKPAPPPRLWQRWWFWTVVGAGVLAAGGAVWLNSGSESSLPMTDLGNKRFF